VRETKKEGSGGDVAQMNRRPGSSSFHHFKPQLKEVRAGGLLPLLANCVSTGALGLFCHQRLVLLTPLERHRLTRPPPPPPPPQMFRALVLFAFAAVAAAFAPSARVARSSSSLKMVFAQGLPGGAGPELKNFDPLKFSEKSPEWTLFFREAELKHGRICMLATLGWIVGDIHHPVLGVSSFEAHAASVSQGGLIQVLIWVSILEHISIIANRELGKGREPGDFAFDPL